MAVAFIYILFVVNMLFGSIDLHEMEKVNSAADSKIYTEEIPELHSWISLLNSSFATIKIKLDASPNHIEKKRAYEKMKNLTLVRNTKADPAYFYFKGKKLAMIYLGDGQVVSNLTDHYLRTKLGNPKETNILRSRAGKSANHIVYAEKGIAFSEENGKILFIEIFPATTHQTYLNSIYKTPNLFIK